MKLFLKFDSETERTRILGFISYVMQVPSSDIAEVEKSLVRHLEEVVKTAYVQGGGKKAQADAETKLKEDLKLLFTEKHDKVV